MKLLIFSIVVTFFGPVFAQEPPVDCKSGLMSQPLCITKINADSFCKGIENGAEVVEVVIKCFQKLGRATQSKRELTALCLMGYSESSKKEDNETNCRE